MQDRGIGKFFEDQGFSPAPKSGDRPSQGALTGEHGFEVGFGKSRGQLLRDIEALYGPLEPPMEAGIDLTQPIPPPLPSRQEQFFREYGVPLSELVRRAGEKIEMQHVTYDEVPSRPEKKEAQQKPSRVELIMAAAALAAAIALGFAASDAIHKNVDFGSPKPASVRPEDPDPDHPKT